ncbi:MAG: hypothetical protein LBG19_02060 [Prevotellaceae bacterium]|jgi:hypothetical protein|nr:hypothetical protein [Prevotellaceae bacterium]
MRYTVFIFLLLLSINTSFGRNSSQLKVPITISVHKEKLHEVLAAIAKQANVTFSYNPQEINTARFVTLDVNAKPLSVVLKEVLGSAATFKQHGSYIILTSTETINTVEPEESEKNARLNFLESKDSALFSKKTEHLASGKDQLICHSSINSKNDEQMKKQITTLLVALAATTSVNRATAQPEQKNSKPFQISFVYPLSSSGGNSINYSYNTSINILGGITGGLNGVEFGGIFNKNSSITSGAQFAGVLNLTQHIEGAQFAGIANISKSANKSAHFAGIINAVKEGETAIQMAGIANAAKSSTVQVAGITNIADTATCQLAGIANIAHKSKVQVGLVNISDEANVQVGLINISKNGFMEVELAGGEFLHATASFRSGTDRLYGIISLGYNFDDEFWGYGIGFGKTINFASSIGMNLEGIHYNLATKKFKQKKYNGLVQLRPVFYHKIAKNLKLFAGPVANLYIGNNTAENRLQISAPYTIWDEVDGNTKLEAWVGFTTGIRF